LEHRFGSKAKSTQLAIDASKPNPDAAYAARLGSLVRGKWRLESLLGVGGMAAVYEASHRNGQRAALKILHLEYARDKTICERFLREAYVSNKVGHPATVRVLDDDVTDQQEPFLIMDLLKGSTVRDLWKRAGRTMPIPTTLQICERVVDCLIFCHRIGVIHRDLKPANIFVTDDGVVKVLDFGVAQLRDASNELTAAGTALGTPSYMSPEQAMGLVDKLDGRADLFSVGAMLHALITGHRINNGRTEQEALVMAATKPAGSVARVAPNLPIYVIKLIDRALAWDRRNRFADAEEMQRALLNVLVQENTAALGPSGGAQTLALGGTALPLAGTPAIPRQASLASIQGDAQSSSGSRSQSGSASGARTNQSDAQSSSGSRSQGGSASGARTNQSDARSVSGSRSQGGSSSGARTNTGSSSGAASPVPSPRGPVVSRGANADDAQPSGTWDDIELSDDASSLGGASQPSNPATHGANRNAQPVSLAPRFEVSSPAVTGSDRDTRMTVVPLPTETAADDDPRVSLARDMMKHFDRLLPTVRQYGWKHPATERTMRTMHEAFADALKKIPDVFALQIRPYSLLLFGQSVWEPGAPFDVLPYNLFACGMRSLQFTRGITYEELRGTVALLSIDPGTELPPEDDLVSAFWERGYPHVVYECCDAFAEGDAAEREAFLHEADGLEVAAEQAAQNHLSKVEMRAMHVSTDGGARATTRSSSPLALESVVRTVLAGELKLATDAWSERFVEVLVDALVEAAFARDAQLMLASLRKSTADLVVAGRFDLVLQLNQAAAERLHLRLPNAADAQRLATGLANALFGGEALELILRSLMREGADVTPILPVFELLSRAEYTSILNVAREVVVPELRRAIIEYLVRHLQGYEAAVAQAASGGIDADASAALVGILARASTAEARQQLSSSDDIAVRLEARVLLAASAESVAQELVASLANPAPLVRLAAARTVQRHLVKSAWPAISRIVRTPQFAALGSDECLEYVRALVLLVPERGEHAAIALRVIACQVLGECSRSRNTMDALGEVAQSRWGTTAEVREAATVAGRSILQRLSQEVRGA
jgi:serine/threonine protein kinase